MKLAHVIGFQWSDGSPVDFENWSGPGRSASGSHDEESADQMATDEDCVAMYQATGAWHRLTCDSLKNWICRIRRGIYLLFMFHVYCNNPLIYCICNIFKGSYIYVLIIRF